MSVGISRLEHLADTVRFLMNFALPGRSAVHVAGAFLTLLVVVTLAPGSARAGCSHGVVSRDRQLVGWTSGDYDTFLVDHRDRGATGSAVPSSGEPRKCPCHGPACSGSPARPDAPTVAAVLPLERWCDTVTAITITCPVNRRARVDARSPLPAILTSPLERPPRLADLRA
jgi:hypothetical protein